MFEKILSASFRECWRVGVVAVCIIAALVFSTRAGSSRAAALKRERNVPVVETPAKKDISVYLTGLGSVTP